MSAIDRIRKKRELLEIEKSGGSQLDVSKKRIEQNRNDLATTGKIDYGETTKFISPIKKKNTKDDGSWTGLFNDGYDRWDISKTILRGGKSLLKTGYKTGKEIVTNPIKSAKTFGVSTAAGLDKARNAIDGAVGDFVDWITPDSWERDSEGPTIAEFNKAITSNSKEEREKVLKQLEKDLDKDDKLYKTLAKDLTSKDTRSDTVKAIDNIINGKYYNTDTYKKYQEGKLSEGQKNIWNVGENIGAMIPSVAVSTVASPVAGSALFYTQAQQNYTEEAKLRGYTDKEARTYGLIMGGAEVLVERLGFDELGGLSKLSQQSIKKAMVGEGLEEFVMPYIDSAVKSVGFDEEFDMVGTTKEAFEGAVLGATVGAIMSAGGRGMMKVDNFIEKVNSGAEITQNDIVEAGRELEQNDPNILQEAISEVPEVVRTQTQTQPTRTVEEIETEIGTLESQLNENLSDEQYNEITNKIKELEIEAEQVEKSTPQLQQNVQPTTQEVETNSLVDASSNTLETGNIQESPVKSVPSPVKSGQVGGQVNEQQTEKNVGYHYGDLGKGRDTNFFSMRSSKRSTGHFGHGTYFLGKKENVSSTKGNRPVQEVDFNDYNLFKANNNSEGLMLHEGLKAINNEDYSSTDIQYLKDLLKSKGISEEAIDNAIEKTMDYSIQEDSKDYEEQLKADSPSTIFMKNLGYEGIDVRGLDRFDNTGYGSVIYDLKNKQETKPTNEKSESIYTSKEQYTEDEIRESNKRFQKNFNENIANERHKPLTDEFIEELTKQSIEWARGSGKLAPIKSETPSKAQEDLSPINKAVEDLKQVQKEVLEQVEDLKETMDEFKALTKEQYQGLQEQLDVANSQEQTPPPEVEVYNDKLDTSALDDRTVNKITKDFARGMKLNKVQKAELNSAIKDISSRGNATTDDVLDVLYNYDEMSVRQRNEEIAEAKGDLKNINSLKINSTIANDVDMPKLRQLAKNNLKFKVGDMGNVDMYYEELSNKYPHLFPSDVITPSQQFEIMVDIASTPIYSYESLKVPHGTLVEEAQYMYDLMQDFKIDQKTKDADKDYKEWVKSLRKTEAPQEISEEVEPSSVKEEISKEAFTKKVEELSGEIKNELGYIPKDPTRAESYEEDEKIAEVIEEYNQAKTQEKKDKGIWAWVQANILDKGMVFENLAIKIKNRELQGKWQSTLTSGDRAQYIIDNGHVDEMGNQTSKSLNDIMEEVNNTGHTKEFYEYMYHKHNVDRMNLSTRFEGMADKPVFGHSVTSEVSQRIADEIEMAHPEFMDFAQDVYDYVNADRAQLVKDGVISQETADLWQQMYPHYVPIRRAEYEGAAINVALDTNRTGINAPIKKATGGNSDILPLFDTMKQRTMQTMRATAKNSFGVELKNSLKSNSSINNEINIDDMLDTLEDQDSLLQEGKDGSSPTFTVFEDGKRVTYEITKEMYEALKPLSESSILSKTIKPLNTASSIHRGLLTQYNVFFALKNGVKDIQDVLINSQHAVKTYSKIPEAISQLTTKGYWYREYMRNGGQQNSYFDTQDDTMTTERKGISKVLDLPPLKQIAQLNDFIERVPRLAEYIASREAGRSIDVSMLDAARVTTNFKAGGNVTKWANRNGATFLNASVQGALQQARNVREANMNGAKGWANLATRFAIAGVPAMILNSLLWGDDDDYEELSDYVKQNYYIVGKYGDGQFYRIPKGRTVAVIQDAIQQISNVATGDDEADLASFLNLVTTNLAPTNPLENNIFAPIIQATTNKTWYGDDLIPSRLADLPAEEQFDETTDSFSRWLGEKTGVSPIKINYLLNQYSGVVGDIVMPMITPKATQEGGSPLLAPLKDIFTVDGVMKNQNVSDFYETSEKLTTGAKASGATDEDILKNKYINSVKTELNDLYKEKREIQSDESLSKSEKYKQAKEIQKEINALTKDALSKYSDGQYTDNYGIIDDREYYVNTKGDWTAVKEKERDALNEMGMSLEEKSTYFEGKNEISRIVNDYKDDKDDLNDTYEDEELKERIDTLSSEKKTNIIKTIQNTDLSEEQQAYLYKKYYKTDTIDNVLSANIGVDNYFDYIQQEFKADLNKKGNPISGSRKNKVINYVNGYDLTIAQKAILIKSTNTFKFNDYNYDIVEYVGGLDIDYEEKVRILKDLDFKVHDNGSVEWE